MEMTLNEGITFKRALDRCLNLKGKSENRIKFFYAVDKNSNKLEPILKAAQKENQPSEGYMKFIKEKIALLEEMSIKDENNKPVILEKGTINERYDVEDMEAFNKEINKLIKKFDKEIKEQEKLEKNVAEQLQSVIEVNVYQIPMELIPDDMDGMTYKQIKPMILAPEE